MKTTRHSYLEFITHVKNEESSKRAKEYGYNYAEENDEGFTGSESLEFAIQSATTGWDSGIKQLDLEDGLLVAGGMEWNPSVRGQAVNINAFLQGRPDSMFESADLREYNLEELTIYAPLVYPCAVNVKDAMNYTQSLIKIVNKYQATHNVRLVGVFDSEGLNGGRMVNEVVIKDFNERFVLNNIAYALHPSFFRRIWFRFLETTDYVTGGYGHFTEGTPMRKRIIKQAENNKSLICPLLWEVKSTKCKFGESDIKQLNF